MGSARTHEHGEGLAITGRGLLSGHGIGSLAFAEGLAEGRAGASRGPLGPLAQVHEVPDFEVRAQLGRAGTRGFDRTTGMAVSAAGSALAERSLPESCERTRVGVVLGSAHGSLRSIVEFTKDVFVQRRPYMVNPAHMPNTVMNCAAGQAAIWHELGGLNATVSSGSTSSFAALDYARLMLARGYADCVLAGGVEELSEQTAWRYHHGQTEAAPALGEGCGVFMLESCGHARASGAKILARLRHVKVSPLLAPASEPEGLRLQQVEDCMRRALDELGIEPQELWATCRAGPGPGRASFIEAWALRRLSRGVRPQHELCLAPSLGDTLSASGALQLGAILALYQRDAAGGPRPALCSAVMEDGTVACMVVEAEQER